MTRIILILVVALGISCRQMGEKEPRSSDQGRLPRAPADVESAVTKYFPGAMAAPELADSLIHHMRRRYHVTPDRVLLGASTCVDDIIYTKNFQAHPEIKGPFHLGGLAGLPFTGTSGLEAFAHHIPEGGTMVLMVQPHIGFSRQKGWGYILRHEQHEVTTCCGALMGTLEKLQKGTLTPGIREEDYQGSKIAELAFEHEAEVLSAEIPIVALTKITSQEAERLIRAHVLELGLEHIKYIVILTGVMINTDYPFSDYQFLDHIIVYDVGRKQFVEEIDNPATHSEN